MHTQTDIHAHTHAHTRTHTQTHTHLPTCCFALQGQYFLKTNRSVPMSQQALMDCSWGFGNNACDGGEAFRSGGRWLCGASGQWE